MCRVFGCVAAEPLSIRHELLDADNPLIRQSEDHDSGWGMAVYQRAEGRPPHLVRFPEAAYSDGEFVEATGLRGRIFNVHVRRATMGDLRLENTHPFSFDRYTLGHNGTVLAYPRLLEPGMRRPAGDTDSEHLFNLLMHGYDPGAPADSLRRALRVAAERSAFSGLNVLFSDGEKLFAYRLGRFELHWLARPGQLLVASEKLTDEAWHSVGQDVLLTLDPDDLEEPHCERLLGDEIVARADIRKIDRAPHLGEPSVGQPRQSERVARHRRRLPSEPPVRAAGQPGVCRGKALHALPAVHATLDELGAAHRTVITRSIEHAAEAAGRAAAEGETTMAVGGDGLLRPLAGALKHSSAGIALIPSGRGNDLARVLGVPTDPAAAARVAVEGKERLLDVANVDGTPFLGIASFGFDSDANRIANDARLVRGNAVYLYAALRALAAWKPARFSVSVDGQSHELTGFSVAIGNSKAYGGGMYVLPQAELDDGRLDVMMSKEASKLTFLRELPKVFKGTHVDSPNVVFLHGERIEVASDRPFVIYADGDPIGATPATIGVEPRCLRVVVPG